jgi:hypothetical protein
VKIGNKLRQDTHLTPFGTSGLKTLQNRFAFLHTALHDFPTLVLSNLRTPAPHMQMSRRATPT